MSDLKISQMTDGGAIQPTDELAANRSGSNVKVKVGEAAAFDVGTGATDLPRNQDLGNASLATIGTGPTQVPTNNLLGALAYLGVVDLVANVTGRLPFTNIATLAGLSVLGRAANTTGDMAAITAANDGEVLRRNGTSVGFGKVNLASANAVDGVLPEARGGTNQGTYTAGDLLIATALNTLGKLGIGRNGQVLKASAGLPAWADAPARNALQNVAMQVAQRYTSKASLADGDFILDRWKYRKSGAMVHDGSQSTDVPTVAQAGLVIPYSLLVDCQTVDSSIAAGDFCGVEQYVEGSRWAQFAQKALFLPFWVKATKTGIYCVSLTNSGKDRSIVYEYTVNASDTWELKLLPIAASPSAGTWSYVQGGCGVRVRWALAGGSTYQASAGTWQTGDFRCTANQVNACDNTANNFRLAVPRLVEGGGLDGFEILPFEEELRQAQRFYEKSWDYATPPAVITTSGGNGAPWWMSPNRTDFVNMRLASTFFKANKMATPTVTLYANNATGAIYDAGAGVDRTATPSNVGQTGFGISGSSVTISANTAFYYGFTAESEIAA